MRLTGTIIKADMHMNGELSLVFEVGGRPCFGTIQLAARNSNAIHKGHLALSALCHATGVLQISDSTQLIGKSLQLEVKEITGPSCESILVAVGW